MVGPAGGATQQAASQTPKSGKKAAQQAQAQTPPRATKQDVFDQQDNGTEEGEEYEETDAGATDDANELAGQAQSGVGNAKGKAQGTAEDAKNQATGGDDEEEEEEEAVPIGSVKPDGSVAREDGNVIGTLSSGDPKKLAGSIVDESGDVLDNEGNVIGAANPNEQGAADGAKGAADGAAQEAGDAVDGVKETGEGAAGEAGEAAEGAKGEGEGAAGGVGEAAEGAASAAADKVGKVGGNIGVPLDQLQLLKFEGPLDFQKGGDVADSKGNVLGQLTEGDPKQLAEKEIQNITDQGQLVGDDGTILGQLTLSEAAGKLEDVTSELPGLNVIGPIDFKENGEVADAKGFVIGKLSEGDPKQLAEQGVKDITEKGELIGEDGKVLGMVKLDDLDKLKEQIAKSQIPSPDVLEGKMVNKAGKVVDDEGGVWGEVIEGDPKKLAGRRCDAEGQIWNDSGKVIGKAQALPEDQRMLDKEAPFEPFPGAKVQKNGDVTFEGTLVGKVVEGDPKKLEGHEVDPDGDINDKHGNTLGRAERYEEPEPEAEVPVDNSILAGKRVNKAGNLVDDKGSLFGRVVEGDIKKLIGKMSDKDGNIWNESGEIIGRAELIPESEREQKKEGPFGNYEGCKVTKDGKVVSEQGEVIGRLIEGDAKQLAGHVVDADGDVIDNSGNAIGKAERWEEPEVEKKHHPCAGYKVNGDGNVIDDNGDIIGKLTDGKLEQCRGIAIDDDGDITNQKHETVGHVTRIQDIPQKSQEEIEAEERAAEEERLRQEEQEAKDKDAKLAKRLSYIIEQYMEKINPVLKDITNRIEAAEATPKEELDEEQLVKEVKPLIEEGGKILEDCNSEIRGNDPDGRIQTQAKMNAAQGEASPEEHRLAEQLKHMSTEVQYTIDNAKKKLAGMPHAKEKLNPLWGLLSEPLFQILAAVGLLLSGVLGLVGRLLGGLGLDSLVGKLLGGLGIDKVMKQFGVIGGGKK